MRSAIVLIVCVFIAAGCSGGGKTYEPKVQGTVDANNVEVRESGTTIHRDPGGDK